MPKIKYSINAGDWPEVIVTSTCCSSKMHWVNGLVTCKKCGQGTGICITSVAPIAQQPFRFSIVQTKKKFSRRKIKHISY